MVLKVHTLTILSGTGPNVVEATVACPERHRAIPLAQCRQCAASSPVDEAAPMNIECELDPTMASAAVSILELPIRDVASVEIFCALGDSTVRQGAQAMSELAIGCLPVIAENRSVIGLVSPVDLLGQDPDLPLRAVMTPAAITLPEQTALVRAAAIMAFEGIHHVPLIDSAGRLTGLLSSLDILRAVGELGKYMIPRTTHRQRVRTGADDT